ncbi:cold-shock protein [Gordonia terrae]
MPTTGTIREWHHDEGWGVIASPALAGSVHVTSFVVRVRAVQNLDELSLPGLRPGTVVDFDHAIAVPPENGCRHVALSVWPSDVAQPDRTRSGVFRKALWHSVGDAGPDGLTVIEETALTGARTPPPTSLMPNTAGTVRFWNDEEGWGVLDSDATPGGAWTFYSEIAGTGFRNLSAGQTVEFQYEQPGQDGYDYRASNIRVR